MNPYLIIGALVGVIVSFIFGGIVGYEYRAGKVPAELSEQVNADTKACDKTQAITKGSNDALQKDHDAIAAKLDALRLQKPARCVPVARTPNIPSTWQQHAGQDGAGVSSDFLRAYAAEAETYRTELTVCTDFIAAERK